MCIRLIARSLASLVLCGVYVGTLVPVMVAFGHTSPPAITVLHGFTGKDGSGPVAPLVQATDGNFYGTTQIEGDDGAECATHACYGTVFKLTPQGDFAVLHTFSWPYADGTKPLSGLVVGPDGYLYGTTSEGGATGYGIVYRISTAGRFQKLHDFCSPAPCKDGESPHAGLALGRDGNFYGRTSWAGAGGTGTVFRISPSGDFATIFAFNTATGGAGFGGVVEASDGNFYGSNATTVFRVTPAGQGSVVHRFDPNDGVPTADLVQAADGNLYGLTSLVVYKLSLGGKYQRFHLLSPAAQGVAPNTLLQTKDARFWGSTGGTSAALAGGAVFSIDLDGTLLQSTFMSETPAGLGPNAPLIQARDGKIYGTTFGYGHAPDGQPVCCGTVFVVDPSGTAGGASPPVQTTPQPEQHAPPVIAPPEQPAPPVVAPPVQPALARVVQATDGLWFLVEESNAWILMPDPISDEDLASITLGDALHGELTVAQPGPARVIRSSDGTLYVVQGRHGSAIEPDQISDADLALLGRSGELDGAIPAEVLRTAAPE